MKKVGQNTSSCQNVSEQLVESPDWRSQILKQTMNLNWNFQKGDGFKQKPFWIIMWKQQPSKNCDNRTLSWNYNLGRKFPPRLRSMLEIPTQSLHTNCYPNIEKGGGGNFFQHLRPRL